MGEYEEEDDFDRSFFPNGNWLGKYLFTDGNDEGVGRYSDDKEKREEGDDDVRERPYQPFAFQDIRKAVSFGDENLIWSTGLFRSDADAGSVDDAVLNSSREVTPTASNISIAEPLLQNTAVAAAPLPPSEPNAPSSKLVFTDPGS